MILGHRQASIGEALSWLHEWIDSFALPPLRAHGLLRNECALLAEKALASSSMKGHPVKMTLQEVNELVLCAY
jgi:alcohol dehydrogenase class IV